MHEFFLATIFVSLGALFLFFNYNKSISELLVAYFSGFTAFISTVIISLVLIGSINFAFVVSLFLILLLGNAYVQRDRLTSNVRHIPAIVLPAIGVWIVSLLIVFVAREANLVSWHSDSFQYLRVAALIAEDNFDMMNTNLAEQRMISTPAMHFLSFYFDEHYVRSAAPLVSVSIISIIVFTALSYFGGSFLKNWKQLVAVGVSILFLVSINRFVFHSFYVNGHLLLAACVLAIAANVALLASGRSGSRPFAYILIGASIMVACFTRPEGFMLAALALGPLMLWPGVPAREKLLIAGWYLICGLLLSYFLISVYDARGHASPLRNYAAPVAGLGLVLAALISNLAIVKARHRHILHLAEAAVWLSLAVLAFMSPALFWASLQATYTNALGGSGAWGYGFVLLYVLFYIFALTYRSDDFLPLRFAASTTVPILFMLVFTRTTPYRVGDGDSFSRMLIEAVPLMVLFIALAAANDRWGLPFMNTRKREETADRA